MIKTKKLLVVLLGFLAFQGTSCQQKTLTLDISNVKTEFKVGEFFTSEGLVVKLGNEIISEGQYEISIEDDFLFESSVTDFQVQVKYGTYQTSYEIDVRDLTLDEKINDLFTNSFEFKGTSKLYFYENEESTTPKGEPVNANFSSLYSPTCWHVDFDGGFDQAFKYTIYSETDGVYMYKINKNNEVEKGIAKDQNGETVDWTNYNLPLSKVKDLEYTTNENSLSLTLETAEQKEKGRALIGKMTNFTIINPKEITITFNNIGLENIYIVSNPQFENIRTVGYEFNLNVVNRGKLAAEIAKPTPYVATENQKILAKAFNDLCTKGYVAQYLNNNSFITGTIYADQTHYMYVDDYGPKYSFGFKNVNDQAYIFEHNGEKYVLDEAPFTDNTGAVAAFKEMSTQFDYVAIEFWESDESGTTFTLNDRDNVAQYALDLTCEGMFDYEPLMAESIVVTLKDNKEIEKISLEGSNYMTPIVINFTQIGNVTFPIDLSTL